MKKSKRYRKKLDKTPLINKRAMRYIIEHNNSGSSAPWEISLVKNLCNWDVISPLRFDDDEWNVIHKDGTCQNNRKSSFFKDPV